MSGALRIAVVTESYDPLGGGSERSTRQMVQGLTERGHAVTVVAGACTPAAADAARETGVPLQAMGQLRLKSARRLRAFSAFAQEALDGGGFDTSLSVTTATPAAVVQPRGGTVVETQRRNIARRPGAAGRAGKRLALAFNAKQRALLALERRTLAAPRVRRVVAISGYVADQLVQHHRVPASKIVQIPNAAWSPADGCAGGRAAWQRLCRDERARLKLEDQDVAFLFAALNPGLKGWPTLHAALRRLANAPAQPGGGRGVVLLAGGFADRDARALAAQGLGPHTRVLGRCGDLSPAYAAADAVVLPTWYDPCSKVVLEGLMVRRPAITTRFNGAAEWLTPPDGPPRGIVLDDPGDAAGLARALSQLVDPAARGAMAQACGGLEDALGMDHHVAALEQVLRDSSG